MYEKTRCVWAGELPVHVAYHDHEWGRPEQDDNKLFKMLILEGIAARVGRRAESNCSAFVLLVVYCEK